MLIWGAHVGDSGAWLKVRLVAGRLRNTRAPGACRARRNKPSQRKKPRMYVGKAWRCRRQHKCQDGHRFGAKLRGGAWPQVERTSCGTSTRGLHSKSFSKRLGALPQRHRASGAKAGVAPLLVATSCQTSQADHAPPLHQRPASRLGKTRAGRKVRGANGVPTHDGRRKPFVTRKHAGCWHSATCKSNFHVPTPVLTATYVRPRQQESSRMSAQRR